MRQEQARKGKNQQKNFARSLSCFVFLQHQNHDKVEDTDAHKTGTHHRHELHRQDFIQTKECSWIR
eukprot:15197717-Ditylum_brightwellii.AAC.1